MQMMRDEKLSIGEESKGPQPCERGSLTRPPGPYKGRDAAPTRFLYIAGIGHGLNNTEDEVRALVEQYGDLDEHKGVELVEGKGFLLLRFVDEASAERTRSGLQGQIVQGRTLKVEYSSEPPDTEPTRPLDPADTVDVEVPGLSVVADFITAEEEASLVDMADAPEAQWRDGLTRRVQHFGYVFNYDTKHVDYDVPTIALPVALDFFNQRLLTWKPAPILLAPVDQLTINEYRPGYGIAPHVDTHSAFRDGLLVLSTLSDVVIEFRHPNRTRRKAVHLPRRSLLIMRGEARYLWTHYIAFRSWDLIYGQRVERSRRISMTFRRVTGPGATCLCAWPEKCDSTEEQRQEFRARQAVSQAEEAVRPTDVEKDYVHAVYDSIAPHWNHTRAIRKVHWPRVVAFLESLPPYSLIADVGCGDGKYANLSEFGQPWSCMVGCDRSLRLLQLSRAQSEYEALACDALKVPFRSGAFDAVLCIAVLHHLSTEAHRLQVLRELLRIARVGGVINIQAWAMEQENGAKRRFGEQDTLVPWKLQVKYADPRLLKDNHPTTDGTESAVSLENGHGADGGGDAVAHTGDTASSQGAAFVYDPVSKLLTYQRYCHLYREWELEGLLDRLAYETCFELVERGYDKGNWFVRIRKTGGKPES